MATTVYKTNNRRRLAATAHTEQEKARNNKFSFLVSSYRLKSVRRIFLALPFPVGNGHNTFELASHVSF